MPQIDALGTLVAWLPRRARDATRASRGRHGVKTDAFACARARAALSDMLARVRESKVCAVELVTFQARRRIREALAVRMSSTHATCVLVDILTNQNELNHELGVNDMHG